VCEADRQIRARQAAECVDLVEQTAVAEVFAFLPYLLLDRGIDLPFGGSFRLMCSPDAATAPHLLAPSPYRQGNG
jgi:hypothetical protein